MEPPVTAMGAAPAGQEKFNNCIFFPKLLLPTMKKNCSGDREKNL